MFLSKSSFTPSCQMRRLTDNYNLMLHRWPGCSINCGQNSELEENLHPFDRGLPQMGSALHEVGVKP